MLLRRRNRKKPFVFHRGRGDQAVEQLLILATTLLFFLSCRGGKEKWELQGSFDPEGGTLIGIASQGDRLWVTDAGEKAVLKLDSSGKKQKAITGFQRPMHPSFHKGKLYVPEFLTDTIRVIKPGDERIGHYSVDPKPDGPASIDLNKGKVAVADFYGHRIILRKKGEWETIGQKGNEKGELLYPTDLEFQNGKLYVADAYNHRVQVFGHQGKSQRVIAASDSIQVASGIDVTESRLAVTDQKGGRVLIYDLRGKKRQVLEQKLVQPTDLLFHGDRLFVTNGRESSVMIFDRAEEP
ncbi:MAG: NHL repeat-containing protein [Flavobacteriales bacterium]